MNKEDTLQKLLQGKNMRQQYKKKSQNAKIIASTWNDEFELLDGSYWKSDIQDYTEYIIKRYETLTDNLPTHMHINKIVNRLVFKIKGGYKLELPISETMKLFGSKIRLIGKTKNGENIPSHEVVEVF